MLKSQYKCEHVLNSEDENFEKDLKEIGAKLKANVMLECVAGPNFGKLLEGLQKDSVII